MVSVQGGNAQINSNVPTSRILLHLLNDTLIFTSEPNAHNVKKLLYPPVPLVYLQFEDPFKDQQVTNVYSIKISNHSVIFVKACNKQGEALAKVLLELKRIEQVDGILCSLDASGSAVDPKVSEDRSVTRHPVRNLELSNDGKHSYKFSKELPLRTDKVLFKALCKSFAYKEDSFGEKTWLSQSTSNLSITTFSDGKNSIYVTNQASSRKLLLASITADASFQQVGAKQLKIYLRNGKEKKAYAFQFEQSEQLQECIEVLETIRNDEIDQKIDAIRMRLPIEALGPLKPEYVLESKSLEKHPQCYVRIGKQSPLIPVGPCLSTIVRYGLGQIEHTHFIIRSTLTDGIVLNTTFLDHKWHCRKEMDGIVALRIFGTEDVDYLLNVKDSEVFIETLQVESKRAMQDEEKRLERIRVAEEKKKKEEEEMRVSVLKSLFELNIQESKQSTASTEKHLLNPKISRKPAPLEPIDSKMDEGDTVKEIIASSSSVIQHDDKTICIPEPTVTVHQEKAKRPLSGAESFSKRFRLSVVDPEWVGSNYTLKYDNDRLYRKFIELVEENANLNERYSNSRKLPSK